MTPFPYTRQVSKNGRCPTKKRKLVKERDNYTCVLCGCDDKSILTVDHIIPTSRGGGRNAMSNLQTLCQPCNNTKGNSLPTDAYTPPEVLVYGTWPEALNVPICEELFAAA